MAKYQNISLNDEDQMRVERIINHYAKNGVEMKPPAALRAAMSAWESTYLPQPVMPTIPSMEQDPEANKRWQDEQIDRQQNHLEYEK